MKATPQQFRHPFMACPACGLEIAAKVTYELALGVPTLDGGGHDSRSLTVDAQARMTRFDVSHECVGAAEDVAEARA